jgi:hypothetical protein
MKTRLTLRPGQRGTRRLVAEHGDRLVCVRYRYDDVRKIRIKTVELIVEECPWVYCRPFRPLAHDRRVLIAVPPGDRGMSRDIQAAGGIWRSGDGAWEVAYSTAERLGIAGLVVLERAKRPKGRGVWKEKVAGRSAHLHLDADWQVRASGCR